MGIMAATWVALVPILGAICFVTANTVEDDPKILILGAGMSGITVAKTLDEKGFKNYLVVEGSSRMGGRMKSVPLSDYMVELGAFWVLGKGTNPIYSLVNEYGVSLKKDPDEWTVRDSTGSDVTDLADKAERRLLKIFNSSESFAKDSINQNLPDFTLRSRLRHFGWRPTTVVDEAVEASAVDWEYGLAPSALSGKNLGFYAVKDNFGNDDLFMVDDPRGYETLVHLLADSFMETDDRILYNKKVTRVKQEADGVVVITADGSRYRGDYVVVTFSLGVLQNREVSFSPALPECKQLAFDKFEFIPFTHLYLQFPYTFWDDTAFLVYASKVRGKHGFWLNLNVVNRGSNILQLSVFEEESRRIERLNDEAIVNDVLPYLQAMYPNITVPFPSNYTISRWNYDPLYRGAWTEWAPGCTAANMENMQAPFGRVYFAGEHLNEKQVGYVHSAHISGMNTANDVIRCLQRSDECPGQADDGFECSDADEEDLNINDGRFG